MITLNQKNIGFALIGVSIILMIIMGFVKAGIDERDTYLCEITHETYELMEDCPAHNTNTSWFITLGFGIAFLLLGMGLYMVLSPEKAKETAKKVDLSKLDDNEKKIYEYIKDNEGSAYQSDIKKETGFSKVKITRILDKMENKEIIERKRRGMTNIIVLK